MQTDTASPRDHWIDDQVSIPLPPIGWTSHHTRHEPSDYAIPAALLVAAAALAACLLAIACL